ncbi:MAG TPA: hypothetical protein VGH20_19490 [Myxococcales bacterium]|jgi:hypothetical protein
MKKSVRASRAPVATSKRKPPFNEFDDLFAQMQGKGRELQSAFDATPAQLGRAAVNAALGNPDRPRRRGRRN